MVNTSPGDSRYIALTTYRRDGRGVTTPVWAAPLDGRLYVVTAESAGKTRRVRATGRVRVAPCNANGRRILGQWREGTGRIVQDEARRREALAALQRKYGWQLSLATLISRLRGNDRHRVILEVSPAPATETVLVEEVADHEKPPILRAYLRAWAWEVNRFFPGVAADASDDVFARIASRYLVFRIELCGPALE